MSRAYRVRVKEALTRDVAADDCIKTQIELLDILPPEQMADLLAKELEARGFEPQEDGTLTKQQDSGVTITVEPCTREVTIEARAEDTVKVEGTREGYGYDDLGPSGSQIRSRLTQELRQDLERRADQQAVRVQTAATAKLEKELEELKPEMEAVVNRVSAEALKQKAAQIGAIKEIHEDAEAGSLTIKVEV